MGAWAKTPMENNFRAVETQITSESRKENLKDNGLLSCGK